MALPGIYNPTEPNPNNVVATDVSKITANFQVLSDTLGLPVSPTQITAPAFSITPAGGVTIAQVNPQLVADPTTGLGIASQRYVDSFVAVTNGGSGNAFTGSLVGLTAYVSGHKYVTQWLNASVGGDTVSLTGLSALPVYKPTVGSLIPILANDVLANQIVELIYDSSGNRFQMISPTPGSVHGLQVLATVGSSNFTVPAFVTTLLVDIYAGSGGGGGGGAGGGGGGGGGGGAHLRVLLLGQTPGASIAYTVGNAGTAGGIGAIGGNGGNSGFGNFTAYAGFGGGLGSTNPGTGGSGGAAQSPGSGWLDNGAGQPGLNGSNPTGGLGGFGFVPGGAGGNAATAGSVGYQGYIIVTW